MEKVKTQIIFPRGLLERLDRVIKKRERSHFVVEAIEEKLKGLTLQTALKRVAGLWQERSDLKTDVDVRRYRKGLRESNAVRERRLRKAWRNG